MFIDHVVLEKNYCEFKKKTNLEQHNLQIKNNSRNIQSKEWGINWFYAVNIIIYRSVK